MTEKDKKAPRNTTLENPVSILAKAKIFGPSKYIYRQEAEGQKSLVNSDTLPTDIGRHSDYNEKAILEAAGVKFLGEVEGDPMFQYVELPPNWRKAPNDHPMWSKLVDEKGRERARIFYKAAFYDRSAHMSLTTRFHIECDYDRQEKNGEVVMNVFDIDKNIYTTNPINLPDKREIYKVAKQAGILAATWLEKKYPDWKNPGAYWD